MTQFYPHPGTTPLGNDNHQLQQDQRQLEQEAKELRAVAHEVPPLRSELERVTREAERLRIELATAMRDLGTQRNLRQQAEAERVRAQRQVQALEAVVDNLKPYLEARKPLGKATP